MNPEQAAADGFEEVLAQRMHDVADAVEVAPASVATVRAAAHRPRRRHRRAVAVGTGMVAAAAALVLAFLVVDGSGEEVVRTGGSSTPAVPGAACIRPGPDGTVGYVTLRPDQGFALIEAGVDSRVVPDGVVAPGGLFGQEPMLVDADQYEALRAAGEPVTSDQLGEMGYDLEQVGPATTSPTTTSAPPPTTTLPPGTTPFDAWVAELRERGLLTPDQEAEVAAGRGISLTAEQSAAFEEAFGSPSTVPNGPVASAAPSGGGPGPPICAGG